MTGDGGLVGAAPDLVPPAEGQAAVRESPLHPLVRDVLLSDGRVAQLRPVAQADEGGLRALNARVSLRTRLRRYFSVSDKPGEWYVDRLLHQIQARSAVVVEVQSQIVGVASFARSESEPARADLGLLVDDAEQHHGIGALLLEHLAQRAVADGIEVFTADVLEENVGMRRLLDTSGFTVRQLRVTGGVVELEIMLEDRPMLQGSVLAREIRAEQASLGPLLAPRSIAVVGSRRRGSVAEQVYRTIRHGGFLGTVEFIDREHRLDQLSGAVDLVVVAVPAHRVLEVARQAGMLGARGLVVLSAGFAESGEAGRALQDELLSVCRESGMRLIGPNCLGLVNTDDDVRLDATFCDARPRTGSVALVSQSGAVGAAALRHAEHRGAGLSLFVSLGNKADVSGNDLLQVLADDPRTDVIALYLESFGNPQKFARIARSIGRTKPIVVLKSGRSAAGARAGASHTAAATTSDGALDALLCDAGVLRVDDLPELFDVLTVLAHGTPAGDRLAIIGNSGGPGVTATDAAVRAGLRLAELSPGTTAALRDLLPSGASTVVPVDLLATVSPEVLERAVGLVLDDPGVDSVLAICTPLARADADRYAAALVRARDAAPGVPLLAAFPGLTRAPAALGDRGGRERLPFFEFPETAVRALAKVTTHARRRQGEPITMGVDAAARTAVRNVIDDDLGGVTSDRWLSPREVAAVLEAYDIPLLPWRVADDADSAAVAAAELGYPVALKAVGPSLVHKTDEGGVLLRLEDAHAVREAFDDLASRLGKRMTSALVQPMAGDGPSLELLAGVVSDPAIGRLVLIGAGGVFTDLLHDVVLRVPPRTIWEAQDQLAALACAPRLHGYRGQPALDAATVARTLVQLGALARDVPEIRELDINPLLVTVDGAFSVDARIRVRPLLSQPDPQLRALSPRGPVPVGTA